MKEGVMSIDIARSVGLDQELTEEKQLEKVKRNYLSSEKFKFCCWGSDVEMYLVSFAYGLGAIQFVIYQQDPEDTNSLLSSSVIRYTGSHSVTEAKIEISLHYCRSIQEEGTNID